MKFNFVTKYTSYISGDLVDEALAALGYAPSGTIFCSSSSVPPPTNSPPAAPSTSDPYYSSSPDPSLPPGSGGMMMGSPSEDSDTSLEQVLVRYGDDEGSSGTGLDIFINIPWLIVLGIAFACLFYLRKRHRRKEPKP